MIFLSGLNTVYTKDGLNCINSGLITGHTDSRNCERKKGPDEIDLL